MILKTNDYYRQRFGGKVYRISLSGGMTCPNRDGTLDTRGCIFCSRGGSGDFAASAALPIKKQLVCAKKLISDKLPASKADFAGYLAYFQSFTNTYAPVWYLEKIFSEALSDDEVVALSVATRPDCLAPECVVLLRRLQETYQKPVYVELGLQTIHEKTAAWIRRGYPLSVYDDAVQRLQASGLLVITHVILGLPYETEKEMLETVAYLTSKEHKVHGLKLQLLHVLKDTDLATVYDSSPQIFPCLAKESYFDLLKKILPLLPEDVVLYRVTGDGPKKDLIAPLWSADKKSVLNALHKIGY